MKTLLIALALASSGAFAQDVTNTGNAGVVRDALEVVRAPLGAGTPAPMITVGNEKAVLVDDGYYHIPQYLPLYPTAGVIWPRIVEVECDKVKGELVCDGYSWLPKLGRGEYIMIMPKMRVKPEEPVIPRNVPPPACCVAPPVERVITIIREVPAKKKGE